MRATSHCIGGEPTGDETPIHYDDFASYAECQSCADRRTRRTYLAGLGAHTLPCPICRLNDYEAALVALRRDAINAAAPLRFAA